MRYVASLAVLLLASVLGAPLAADEGPAPAPRLDRIDYAKPDAQRALGESLGVGRRTFGIARQLTKSDAKPVDTLARIVRWVDRNLKLDAVMAGRWRGVDQIVRDGSSGGAADRALVIGVLARAAGIPATWVKSLSTQWLIDVKSGRAAIDGAAAHVFLEVYLDGRWRLFDPRSARLYESYDPRAPRLPSGQRAYDKGGDPYALVLPNRGEQWRKQLRAYIDSVALAQLPWARSRDLLAPWRVYVAGKGGPANYARATAKALGYKVEKCINTNWDKELSEARGRTLIVVTYGLEPALPKQYHAAWLPKGYEQILAGRTKPAKGWIAHRRADGTRVILVTAKGYGPVELAVSEALED